MSTSPYISPERIEEITSQMRHDLLPDLEPNGQVDPIQISRQESPRRQNFSVAHEIGHIILHDYDTTSNFVKLRQKIMRYDQQKLFKEVQANMFASALLLPKEEVEKVWRATNSIDEIAELFNVSRDAVYYRLNNLNMLDNE